jgi:hypothetical protein
VISWPAMSFVVAIRSFGYLQVVGTGVGSDHPTSSCQGAYDCQLIGSRGD